MWKCSILRHIKWPDIEHASRNKRAQTHAVVRENDGLLREIVGRLTSMAQDVTHNTNGSMYIIVIKFWFIDILSRIDSIQQQNE